MSLDERLDKAEEMIQKPSFRENKGLGNEVGYYIFDYPAEKEIALTPVNTDSITTVALTGLSENLYELQLTQSQLELAERQKRMITNGYIPSLSLTGNWRYAAYTDKGYHWFHSGPSNHWFSFVWTGADFAHSYF